MGPGRKESRVFLESIEISFIEPCFADPERIRFGADLPRDISHLLPYLNAVLCNALFNPEAKTLTFNRESRVVSLYPDRLTVAKARNTTDAYQVLDWIRDVINDTYERQDAITPVYVLRQRPSVLEILKWLPRDSYNCRQCGEATCISFALRLWLGERKVQDCMPILASHQAEALLALEALVGVPATSQQGSRRGGQLDTRDPVLAKQVNRQLLDGV